MPKGRPIRIHHVTADRHLLLACRTAETRPLRRSLHQAASAVTSSCTSSPLGSLPPATLRNRR